MPAPVVGREAELAVIKSFVDGLQAGPSAALLQGEAGVGKTTLWSAGIAATKARGIRVLRACAGQSETSLSFSGIGDLLDPVLDEVIVPLPRPQRRALARALLIEEDDDEGPPPDPHAIGVAVLSSIRSLARTAPVVVAIDDLQWLDRPSVDALSYAARRIRGEPVGILLTLRVPSDSGLVAELRRSLPRDGLHELEVGPLDVGALGHVVRSHLDVVLPRPLLLEVHEASGGNPFYALEIVRTVKRTGSTVEAGHPLPMPESLRDLVHERLLALPAESRRYLLAAAAHAHPTVSITEAASGIGRDVGLSPAIAARLLEIDGDRIRFTHPLLAACAYETADPASRKEVHARLAELLSDPEARAWQLAAAVEEPGEDVAGVLEAAAERARARGAPRPAALLLDRARELTPSDQKDDAVRRGVKAAYLHFESGDTQRAETQLRDEIASATGLHRAKARWTLARIRSYEAPGEAAELFARVVEEAEGDPLTLAQAHEGVASTLYYMLTRLREALEHAEVAFELAVKLGDDALAGDVLISKLGIEALLARPTVGATADRAFALQVKATDRRLLDQPLLAVAEYWSWVDRCEHARQALLGMLQSAKELGDESSRPYLLFLLGQAEILLGSLESALAHAREAQESAEELGEPMFGAYGAALESLAQAQLGRPEAAREAARRALGLAPEMGANVRLLASFALGHLELALGAPAKAVACLEPMLEHVRREEIAEPGAIRFVVDHLEGLVETGRREDAVELLDWYETTARRLERASAIAASVRCRGLVAASHGLLEDALAAYEQALEWHSRAEIPLDRGRTILALGIVLRRMKRRRDARRTLEQALASFETIGARLWAERARAELRRISGRAPSATALTPAEERVVALVMEGKTNREVGAALYLSERTVEGHLSRVFGKLGIRHRAQLARALTHGQSQGSPASHAGDSPVSAESRSS